MPPDMFCVLAYPWLRSQVVTFRAAAAVMAMNHDPPLAMGLEFGQTAGDLLHGDELGALDPHQRVLVWLAAVQQQKVLAGIQEIFHRVDIDVQRQFIHVATHLELEEPSPLRLGHRDENIDPPIPAN